MKWPTKQLDEVADFRLGKMLDEKKNRGDLLPYLANVNVRWGEFDFSELREMRFEDHELDTFGLRKGDIVMCEGGEPGRCAIWKEQRPGMMIQKAIHRIRPRACLDHEFLFYTFIYMGKTGLFAPLFTGATIKHLPREKLALLRVPVPPQTVQKRIADTLSAYDDLIENNRRRMALLEESARLLYQEWFVRLHFPGHEHVRVIDGVPEGWEQKALGACCATLEDGDWIESKDQGGDDYRLLQISNIGSNAFVETGNYRFISEDTFRKLNCRELKPGDILISRMPKPIGRAWLVTDMPWKMVTAVDAAIATTGGQSADPYFLVYCLNSQEMIEKCERRAVGATRPRIARRELSAIPAIVPPPSLQRAFRDCVQPMYEQQFCLYRQTEKLRAARDLLLPRLMSGEIAI
jgi:type I restriction enzyme S subunit